MPQSTAQEQGHLYKAEKPNYHKGQTGKGASIKGSLPGKLKPNFPTGDGSAQALKKVWNKALNASKRFPPF